MVAALTELTSCHWLAFGCHVTRYCDVDIISKLCGRPIFDSLQGFWPGLQALVGEDLSLAADSLNAFLSVFSFFGGVPEEFDWLRWQLPSASSGGRKYPLRPELIESIMYLYQATRDSSWLQAGAEVVDTLQRHNIAPCGYSTIAGALPFPPLSLPCSLCRIFDDCIWCLHGLPDVSKYNFADEMPSFFLSETLKYLYLLFDEDNFVHREPFIFTTEGHPIPVRTHANVISSLDCPGDTFAPTEHEAPTDGTSRVPVNASVAAAEMAEAWTTLEKSPHTWSRAGLAQVCPAATIGGYYAPQVHYSTESGLLYPNRAL